MQETQKRNELIEQIFEKILDCEDENDVERIIALCRGHDFASFGALPDFDHSAGDPGYWGWLQTYTGKKFYPLQPEKYEIDILDLVHGCAIENRYGGQTEEPYSVAQHSCLVATILAKDLGRPDLEFEGLMHDSAEGLLKDLPRDIKLALPTYKALLEHPLEKLIAAKFGLRYPFDPLVKKADNIALMTERRDLFRCVNEDWTTITEPRKERIFPWGWDDSEDEMLRRFHKLHRARKAGER